MDPWKGDPLGFVLIMSLEDGRPEWGVGRGIGKGDTGPNASAYFPTSVGAPENTSPQKGKGC